MPKILRINYGFSGSWCQLQQQFTPGVQMIADVPGLRWKTLGSHPELTMPAPARG